MEREFLSPGMGDLSTTVQRKDCCILSVSPHLPYNSMLAFA